MSAAGPRILRSQVRVRSLVGAWGRSAPNDGSEAPGFPFHPQHARHKALAIVIAGALAAPTMAAQAVDFTLSGQVGRTLFVNDSDTSTNPMSLGSDGEIRDNNGATRFRMGEETAISGSAGVTLPSGLAVAGAWGRGDGVAILGTASAAVPA